MEILEALKNEAEKLQQKLETLNGAIKALGGGSPTTGNPGKHRNGRRKVSSNGRRKHRKWSAAARKRASEAKKQWWAAKAKAKAPKR